ncbi:MAG: hypothetical protein CSA74_00160 [Rhodobacterales bacterium]|nr:MAG: hypothetical protein CSA74_00160 [Rhodobacterales bacterium]
MIEQVGSPLELFHKPVNRFVAGFIGNPNMNFLDATCLGSGPDDVRVKLVSGAEALLPVDGKPAEGEALVPGIRPDDLRVGKGEARLEMMPEVVERLGNHSIILGVTSTRQAICAQVDGAAPIAVGTGTELGFDGARAHLFRADGAAFERRVNLADLSLPA